MTIHRCTGRLLLSLAIALGSMGSVTASASPVYFLDDPSDLAVGFDPTSPGFPTEVDIDMPVTGPFADASQSGSPVQYDVDHCFLVSGKSGCQSNLFFGQAYTDVVTLTLESVDGGVPAGGLLIFLSGLSGLPAYDVDEVAVELDPSISGFSFDEFLHLTLTVEAVTYHYLGFHFDSIGDSATFQYDVSSQRLLGTPALTTNAFVPEPGTGVLFGIGLIGLGLRKRR